MRRTVKWIRLFNISLNKITRPNNNITGGDARGVAVDVCPGGPETPWPTGGRGALAAVGGVVELDSELPSQAAKRNERVSEIESFIIRDVIYKNSHSWRRDHNYDSQYRAAGEDRCLIDERRHARTPVHSVAGSRLASNATLPSKSASSSETASGRRQAPLVRARGGSLTNDNG